MQSFIQTLQVRYPQLTAKLEHNEHLLVCFNFPRAIRASIYSTNLIESLTKSSIGKPNKGNNFLMRQPYIEL